MASLDAYRAPGRLGCPAISSDEAVEDSVGAEVAGKGGLGKTLSCNVKL